MDNLAIHIAINIDSVDRYLNLIKLLDYIRTVFPNVKVRVCEQDKIRKLYLRDNKVSYFFLKTKDVFNKNECYNLLALRSVEEYIINNDCDYFTLLDSYLEAINNLRNSEVSLVHNGTILSTTRDNLDSVSSNLSLMYENYYSGIVAYRGSFLRVFKENSNMKCWGFDSNEKDIRYNKLGIKLGKTSLPAYHMYHERGANSSKQNPLYPSNSREYQKIVNMLPDELTNYIMNIEVRQF